MKRIITSLTIIASMMVFVGQAFAAQLDAQTRQALIDAINDEYKAKATYQKVLEKFGDVRPFSNIIKAEEHHIEELLPLFEKYEVAVPEDNWSAKVPEFATLEEALKAGVEAEIENAKMYDEFFKFVEEEDIIAVFTKLRDASQDNHLQAFQRALEGGGNGRGRQSQAQQPQAQSRGPGRGRRMIQPQRDANPQGGRGQGRGGWNEECEECKEDSPMNKEETRQRRGRQ